MTDGRVARVLLKFEIAQARQASAEVARIRDQLGTVQQAARQTTQEASRLQQALTEAGRVRFAQTQRELDQLTAAVREQARAAANAAASGDSKPLQAPGNIGAVFSGLAQALPPELADSVRALGGALEGLGEKLPRLIDVITSLNPVVLTLVGAIGTAVTVIEAYNRQNANLTAGLRELTERERAFYELRITGTTESVQAALRQAELETKIAEARVNDLRVVEQGYQETAQYLGALQGLTGAVIELGAIAGMQTYRDIRDLRLEYENAQQALARAQRTQALYNQLLADAAVQANDAAAAEQRRIQTQQVQAAAALERDLQARLEVERFLADASVEAFDKRRTALTQERQLIEAQLAAAEALAREGSPQVYDRLQERIAALDAQLRLLDDGARAAIATLEAQRQAEAQAASQRRDMIEAVKRYQADVTRIEAQAAAERAAAAARLNDALIRAAEQAATAAANALQQLQTRRQQLAQQLAQGEAQAAARAQQQRLERLIQASRDEERQARELARRLRDIRERYARDEQDAIEARDFARLFELARSRERELTETQRAAKEQRAERELALQQQLQDQAEAYARERAERQAQYQQQLAEAQVQYQQELALLNKRKADQLAAARQQYRDELLAAQQKAKDELLARREAIQQELTMIKSGLEARLKLEQQYWQQALRLLASMTPSAGGGPILPTRQYGGYLNTAAWVNEAGPEGFRVGNRWAPFPPGLGVFFPAQPGQVERAGRTMFQQTIHIHTGAGTSQVQALVPLIRAQTRAMLADYFG